MPSKRQFRRLRRLRWIGGSGAVAVLLGGAAALFGASDAIAQRPGGMVGVAVGFMLITVGVVSVVWAVRAFDSVAAAEWQELRARGDDDGLPLGAFLQGQRVGLEASDALLIRAVVAVGIGLVFLVSSITDPQVGWRFGLWASLVGFLPAALFFRLGTGVKYWLTEDGVARHGRLRPAVYWADVERIVPIRKGVPVATSDHADAFELQVGTSKQSTLRRWLGADITIKLVLVEIDPTELLSILSQMVPTSHEVGDQTQID